MKVVRNKLFKAAHGAAPGKCLKLTPGSYKYFKYVLYAISLLVIIHIFFQDVYLKLPGRHVILQMAYRMLCYFLKMKSYLSRSAADL